LLPQLDAIADTIGGDVIRKLIPKLKRGGVLGSVVGKPDAAETKTIRVEAVLARADAARMLQLAEAVRDGALSIPIVRKFRLSEAPSAQTLVETGGVDGKVVIVP
jgi:NADPH:quinone reductase-like Zn-dependent oxidoreductase